MPHTIERQVSAATASKCGLSSGFLWSPPPPSLAPSVTPAARLSLVGHLGRFAFGLEAELILLLLDPVGQGLVFGELVRDDKAAGPPFVFHELP